MSEVYVQDPPTLGSVVIKTNKGELFVELWSRECPKACRNFVQNCLEGYYNGTIFHRIIPDFIIQTGDPRGLGDTCESVYGEPYPDEFHTRLKFRYRGMIGVANAGRGANSNGSQFFITLVKLDSLNGQNTLFGKVVGNSVYTVARIAEMEVDKYDRPVANDPPVILETVVTDNPFPDIVPRFNKPPYVQERVKPESPKRKPKIAGRRTGVLSFADEEDETSPAARVSSAHDVLTDKALAKQSIAVKPVDPIQKTSRAVEEKHERKQPLQITTHSSHPEKKSMPKQSIVEINAEIERVTKALQASSGSKPSWMSTPAAQEASASAGPNRKRRAESSSQEDSMITNKLKAWRSSVSKLAKTSSETIHPASERGDYTTLHTLISSAEGDGDEGAIASGSWLKSAGSVKFAVDRRAGIEKFRK